MAFVLDIRAPSEIVYEESCLALCEENITREENPGNLRNESSIT